jgi:hypothetical protein
VRRRSTPFSNWVRLASGEGCETAAGWDGTGWCFPASAPDRLVSGKPVTLSLSACRRAGDSGTLRFPTAVQARWELSGPQGLVWSSAQRPSPFRPGDALEVASGFCVEWLTQWKVTANGKPIPAGSYTLRWTSAADVRDPLGQGFVLAKNIRIG